MAIIEVHKEFLRDNGEKLLKRAREKLKLHKASRESERRNVDSSFIGVYNKRNKHNPQTTYQWQRAINELRVIRRLYANIPDYVCVRLDYLSNTETAKESRKRNNSLFFIGYIIRYGFWTPKGFITFDNKIKKRVGIELGYSKNEVEDQIKDCLKLGLLIRHADLMEREMYSLNSAIIKTIDVEEIVLKPKENTGKI